MTELRDRIYVYVQLIKFLYKYFSLPNIYLVGLHKPCSPVIVQSMLE